MSENEPTAARPTSSARGQSFFDRVRRIGVSRGDGWIGGVCGGIAARLGIDPIIVRGIVVVVALLGGPAFLFYAVAWALLPDTSGTIHLERLVRGVFDAASVGVIVFALLAFLPIAQGVWWAAGWPFGVSVGWPESLGKLFWSAIVIGGIVWVVVWLSRRSGNWTPSGLVGAKRTASASDPSFSASPLAVPSVGAPVAPEYPVDSPTDGEVADWRVRQAEWKVRFDEWKSQQADATRAAREQRTADAAARQAEALELARIDRLANPRTSGPFIAITLGVAVIVGAVASAVAWGLPEIRGYQTAFGFGAATAVVGLAMIVAGMARRRSGFLAFVAIVLTLITVGCLSGHVVGSWSFTSLPSFSFSY